MNLRRKFNLFLNVVAIVGVLILAKLTVHQFGLEFLGLDGLFQTIIGSAIFIIGFLLSSLLPDYKEAERIPSEIRMALEGINDDVVVFAGGVSGFDIAAFQRLLVGIVVALEDGLGPKGAHSNLEAAIAKADALAPAFAQLERLGMAANLLVRLRSGQDVLRRCLYRIYYIQKMEFLPSVHALILTLVMSTLFLLMFLKTDGSFGASIIFGVVSYMFIYALHLVDVLEQPFRSGDHTPDNVSLFLLRDFAEKLGGAEAKAPLGVREATPARVTRAS
jgi:hypothetical protein